MWLFLSQIVYWVSGISLRDDHGTNIALGYWLKQDTICSRSSSHSLLVPSSLYVGFAFVARFVKKQPCSTSHAVVCSSYYWWSGVTGSCSEACLRPTQLTSKPCKSSSGIASLILPPTIVMKRGFLKSSKEHESTRKKHQKDNKTETNLKTKTETKTSYGLSEDADNTLLYTTQPSQELGATLTDVPDGWSECFISALSKRKILSTPGFPQSIARTKTAHYRIAESPGKGLGMFATRDLDMGDLILAERPILVAPDKMEGKLGNINGLTAEQVNQAMLYTWEKRLEVAFSRVAPENQVAFRLLHNSHLHDGSRPIMGVMQTNGFGITLCEESDQDQEEALYSAVFKDGSRINHSCTPNVFRHWDMRSFSMQFRASRSVKKDEELTTWYCLLSDPSATRQQFLAQYGIHCDCNSCMNPSVSDARRAGLIDWPGEDYLEKWKAWIINPAREDDMMVSLLKEDLQVFEEEGLEASSQYRLVLQWILNSYVVLADEENAVVWGKRIGRWHWAATGDKGELTRLSKAATHRADAQWGLRKMRPVILEMAKMMASRK